MVQRPATLEANSSHRPRRLPRLRFSLAWLLVVVTTIALVLGLSVTVGSFVATVVFGFVYCVLPTPLVICAIFARGDAQAFAIGALVPWWTHNVWLPNASFVSLTIWLLAMCSTCGIVAAFTRRWIVASNG